MSASTLHSTTAAIMPSLMDRIQAKLELLRLEKRYTRSRHRRSAFVSNAVYIDGEYVFQQTPSSTGSSSASSHASMNSHGIDALHGDKARPMVDSIPEAEEVPEMTAKERKRLNRFSSMPTPTPTPRDAETADETKARKKLNRFSSMPGFGGSYGENAKASRPERRLSMIR